VVPASGWSNAGASDERCRSDVPLVREKLSSSDQRWQRPKILLPISSPSIWLCGAPLGVPGYREGLDYPGSAEGGWDERARCAKAFPGRN
jgi:hypothetical protein